MSEERPGQTTEATGDGRREPPPPARRRVASNERPSVVYKLAGYAALFVVGVSAVVVGFLLVRELGLVPTAATVQQAPPSQARGGVPGPVAPLGIEDATISGEERAKLALAKSKQQRFVSQGKEVLTVIGEWLKEMKGFETATADLLVNDDGKALAGDRELLSQFGAVFEADRPGRPKAEDLRSQVETLIEAVESSLKDPSDASIPAEDLTRQLAELLAQAKDGRNSYRKAREQLDSLVTQARAAGTAGSTTLRQALTGLRREEAAKEAKIVETARANAREEATAKLAQEKAEHERAEGEKQRQLEQSRHTATIASKERERLQRLAKEDAIKARYQAVLALGRYSFNDKAFFERERHVSLSQLQRGFCLASVENFAKTLCGQPLGEPGGVAYRTMANLNDRPKGVYPQTRADWARMETWFNDFKELAPIWVEMGLLEN